MAIIRIPGTYIYQGGPSLPIMPYAFARISRCAHSGIDWPVTCLGFGADTVDICPSLTKEALIKLGNQLLKIAEGLD